MAPGAGYFLIRQRLLEPQAGKFMQALQILKYTSGVAVLVQEIRMLYQVGQHRTGIMFQQDTMQMAVLVCKSMA